MAKQDVEYILTLTENINKKLDRLNKKTGKFEKGLGKTDKTLGRLQANLLRTFGAAVIIRGLTKAVSLMADFEQEVSFLSSITGQTGRELAFLRIQAFEMGLQTTKSAKEVVQAFKLVGSERPELLKDGKALAFVTQNALTLAEAAGLQVPEAAKALTTGLAQFNAPAKESARFMNAIAAGSKFGAGNIPFLAAAIEKAGTVVADGNSSFEEMIGLVETLAPKIKEPTTLGLNLKNVFLRLQSAGVGFSSGVFNINDALDELAKKQLSVTKLEKLFGRVNITAGKILIDQRAELKRYTKAVTGTNTAVEQASINTDNLRGDIDRIKGKFQGFILGLNRGQGAITGTARGFLQIGANVLDAITATEKMSDAVKQEFIDMNSLVSKITSANIKQKERNELILQLQKVYPDYFGQLDADKTKNEDLKVALAAANSELVKRIVLLEQEEKIEKARGKEAKVVGRLASSKAEAAQIAAQLKLNKDLGRQGKIDPIEILLSTLIPGFQAKQTQQAFNTASLMSGLKNIAFNVQQDITELNRKRGVRIAAQTEATAVEAALSGRSSTAGEATPTTVNVGDVTVNAGGKTNAQIAKDGGKAVENELNKALSDEQNN